MREHLVLASPLHWRHSFCSVVAPGTQLAEKKLATAMDEKEAIVGLKFAFTWKGEGAQKMSVMQLLYEAPLDLCRSANVVFTVTPTAGEHQPIDLPTSHLTLLDGARVFAIPLDVSPADEGPDRDVPARRPAQARVAGGLALQVVNCEVCSFLHKGHGVVADCGAYKAGKSRKATEKQEHLKSRQTPPFRE